MGTTQTIIQIPDRVYKNLEKVLRMEMTGKTGFDPNTYDPENMKKMVREIARTGFALGMYMDMQEFKAEIKKTYHKLLEEISYIEGLKSKMLAVEGMTRPWNLSRSEILEVIEITGPKKGGIAQLVQVQNGSVKYLILEGRHRMIAEENYFRQSTQSNGEYKLGDRLVNLSAPQIRPYAEPEPKPRPLFE